MKVLIFEGAGVPNSHEEVGNCRLRTCFINLDGDTFYLEMLNRRLDDTAYIDFIYKENKTKSRNQEALDSRCHIKYTKQSILDMVNRNYRCNFDSILIDDNLNVHQGGYNYDDLFKDKYNIFCDSRED